MAYRQKNYTYNPTFSEEENVLLDRLFKLRLSHMAEALERQLLDPNSGLEEIESRDCRKSTMIVSQFPVKKWWDFFQDSTYADACLSRMTSKAYRLECNGRDMRNSS